MMPINSSPNSRPQTMKSTKERGDFASARIKSGTDCDTILSHFATSKFELFFLSTQFTVLTALRDWAWTSSLHFNCQEVSTFFISQ